MNPLAPVCLFVLLAGLQTPSCPTPTIVHVPAGTDLQQAIDQAPLGTTLLVAPGTYQGIVLRAKGDGPVLTIQPDNYTVPAGQRVAPSNLPQLVQLVSRDGTTAPITTEASAKHYLLRGIAPQPYGDGSSTIVLLGSDATADPLTQPDDLTFDQLLVMADSAKGGHRGIAANTRGVTVKDSYIAGFAWSDDSQALAAWNGPGPFDLENNYLEATGENVMFGGSDSKAASLMPQHITVRGNYFSKPLAWRGKAGITSKNILEFKVGVHVLVENNVLENSWANGQAGYGFLLTTRDQSGTAPWSQVADVTFQYNVLRHCGAGISILGLDDGDGNPAARPSVRMTGVRISNNLVYDIDPQHWSDPLTGTWGDGRLISILQGPDAVVFSHNTMLGVQLNSALTIGDTSDVNKTTGLQMLNNVLGEGQYGIAADSSGLGYAALLLWAPGVLLQRNLFAGGPSAGQIDYGPGGNIVTASGQPAASSAYVPMVVVTTTDGLPVGVDLAGLHTRIPWVTWP